MTTNITTTTTTTTSMKRPSAKESDVGNDVEVTEKRAKRSWNGVCPCPLCRSGSTIADDICDHVEAAVEIIERQPLMRYHIEAQALLNMGIPPHRIEEAMSDEHRWDTSTLWQELALHYHRASRLHSIQEQDEMVEERDRGEGEICPTKRLACTIVDETGIIIAADCKARNNKSMERRFHHASI